MEEIFRNAPTLFYIHTVYLYFFSFIEEKKYQKEELLLPPGYFDLCGGR